MKIVFLGTSAAQPTESRNMSCTCIEREGEVLMFDAGEGTQLAYSKSKLGWNKKMKIFITHMHGDHCIGLLGLLQTMTMQTRTEPLEVYGPKGIDDFIASNVKILNFGIAFPLKIQVVEEGVVLEETGYTVQACRSNHSVYSLAYLFEEKDRPGRFYPEKAKELGIPEGKLWHELQTGKEVTVEDRTIRPSDVMGEKRPGKRIGISGDTRPTEKLQEFFKDCHYLVFDSTFSDELKNKAMATFHSTAKEAAELAANANVSNLVLTHFSTRYTDADTLKKEAMLVHNSVIAAEDLLELEIK